MNSAIPSSIAAVILNWNNYAESARCIRSIRGSLGSRLVRIWVVDNGSLDQSGEMLEQEFPDVTFIFTGENLGFSGGMNAGLKVAYRENYEFFLIVNNDVEVVDGFLDQPLEILSTDKNIGMVTGKCLARKPAGRILHAGGHIDERSIRGIPRGWGEMDRGQYDNICDTQWAAGTLCLFPRATLERLGFLPEEYFFGYEEYEYSTRALKAALRIVYCPKFKYLHKDAASHKPGHPVLMVYNMTLNKFLYARRNLTRAQRRRLTLTYLFYLLTLWPILPGRASRGCRSLRDFRCRYISAWLGFFDRNRSERITLEMLIDAQRRIGTSESWGKSWGETYVTPIESPERAG
jgi:GT2 family glycosyltransferase